jgi:hypothetical protein
VEDKVVNTVDSIYSRKFLGDYYYSQSKIAMPDGIRFYTGATLTLVLLPLAFVLAGAGWWLFILLMLNEALGAALGVLMFKNASHNVLSCFPVHRLPQFPSGTHTNKLKLAA